MRSRKGFSRESGSRGSGRFAVKVSGKIGAIHQTPRDILHFKTACGLLDDETVFCTRVLGASGCFSGYRVIDCPSGEEAAANLVRIDDVVLVSAGYPKTANLLASKGYQVKTVSTVEAARLDGGLSCMSLQFRPPTPDTGA